MQIYIAVTVVLFFIRMLVLFWRSATSSPLDRSTHFAGGLFALLYWLIGFVLLIGK